MIHNARNAIQCRPVPVSWQRPSRHLLATAPPSHPTYIQPQPQLPASSIWPCPAAIRSTISGGKLGAWAAPRQATGRTRATSIGPTRALDESRILIKLETGTRADWVRPPTVGCGLWVGLWCNTRQDGSPIKADRRGRLASVSPGRLFSSSFRSGGQTLNRLRC